MHIQKKKTLTMDDIQRIIELVHTCEENDRIEYQSNLHVDILKNRKENQINDFLFYTDDRLIGLLSMFEFERPTKLELLGFVHPDFRKQKIGSLLVQKAMEEIQKRNINEVLLIINGASTSGKEFAQKAKFQYVCSEYSMLLKAGVKLQTKQNVEIQLTPASTENFPALLEIASKAFGDSVTDTSSWLQKTMSSPTHQVYVAVFNEIAVGTITISIKKEFVSISGFAVSPSYQGKGFGKNILQHIVLKLVNEGHQNIGLDVETKNENALKLYKQCGFEITASHDYYNLLHQ
ncbi:GNAT family N-acetyltransferase [Bacillus sp. DX4.1]|uniref:GNAT family N-acetyltransferase n=1 Tax=Bacillus sp. DX4.1 TaxID=3055867 RepID=UPI0025A04DF8|nr:GNAT family N-acetyltransferase [Bacillus sp. DX4.1]MDM5188328.1 GNAT family N-acetyltransferase [Bacillus sp. DX4.1]